MSVVTSVNLFAGGLSLLMSGEDGPSELPGVQACVGVCLEGGRGGGCDCTTDSVTIVVVPRFFIAHLHLNIACPYIFVQSVKCYSVNQKKKKKKNTSTYLAL